ncbi:hypothetical protein ACHJH3_00285 [Campylobacter sp. MOP7]|uniref:hypothetical protein n=1 Tax=Campylobacter canis TaxID=3378588 RepID=UPI00387EBEF8
MSSKKWIYLSISIPALLLFIIGIFNFIIDPLQQYRKAGFYNVFFRDERHLNPGLAKNWTYNSISTGSSVTENFLISDLANIIKNPIKLPMSGATAKEINLILNLALSENQNIGDVLISLDIFSMSGNEHRTTIPPPLYLYKSNFLNSAKYLLSLDTARTSFKFLRENQKNKNNPKLQYETMYQWQHEKEDDFSKKKAVEHWRKDSNQKLKKFELTNGSYKLEILKKSFNSNYLSLFEHYSNVNFVLFYPPYSVLEFKDWLDYEVIEDILELKRYISQKTSRYQNVKIYDFQNNPALTTHLDNYSDAIHYHQKINTLIIEEIKKDNYLIDTENYETDLKNFIKYVEEFKIER